MHIYTTNNTAATYNKTNTRNARRNRNSTSTDITHSTKQGKWTARKSENMYVWNNIRLSFLGRYWILHPNNKEHTSSQVYTKHLHDYAKIWSIRVQRKHQQVLKSKVIRNNICWSLGNKNRNKIQPKGFSTGKLKIFQ